MIKRQYKKAGKYFNKAKNILVISHRRPDADTLGTAIALKIWLSTLGKTVALACVDKPGKSFSFLPYVDEFVQDFDLSNYDLMVVVDAGASYMTNFHLRKDNLFNTIPVINIDHHASNDNYGTVNIVEPEASSTTIILYKMLCYYGAEINKDMATALLAGIYSDTGSFMHSNTNKEVYDVSADLVNKGAKIAEISKNLFRSKSINTLRLMGRVLEKAYLTDDRVVMSIVKRQDYEEARATEDDLAGVVDYLNMVPQGRFAVLINEDRKGNVKGSFRTRKLDVDVSKIAETFGGGGHPKASGFSIPGKLQEEISYSIIHDNSSKKRIDFS